MASKESKESTRTLSSYALKVVEKALGELRAMPEVGKEEIVHVEGRKVL